MPVLLIITGPRAGTRFVFERDSLLGRSSECQLRVHDGRMSRRHARLIVDEQGVALEDLGSRNGTFLNENPVSTVSRLSAGDHVRVGETVLVFEPNVDLVPSRYSSGAVIVDYVSSGASARIEVPGGSVREAIEHGPVVDSGLLATRLAARLAPTVGVAAVLTAGLDEVAELLRADHGAVLLSDDSDRLVSPAAMVGTEEMLVDRSLIRRVLDSSDSVLIDLEAREMRLGMGDIDSAVAMAAPITGRTRPQGMIVLERRKESSAGDPWDGRALAAIRVAGAMLGGELARVMTADRFNADNAFLARGETPDEPFVVGDGPRLRKLLDDARNVARVEKPVLLSGEIGSGRALVARYIHEHSSRSEGPLRLVQCGSALEVDIRVILSGEEGLSFTGGSRTGVIEASHRGTLYLEDVDLLPEEGLAILRTVQREGMLTRMGGTRPIPMNVRYIASTRTAAGRARAQALLGPGAVVVEVPALRERSEDVPLLFSHFAHLSAYALGRSTPIALSSEGRRSVETYEWPGNVRELKNLVERLTLLEEPGTTIGPRHMPGGGSGDLVDFSATLAAQISTLEEAAISRALKEEAKKINAARRLGISRPTLDRKILLYGLCSGGRKT